MSSYYHRFAAAGADKVKKVANKQIQINCRFVSADAQSTLTFSDTKQSIVVDVAPGVYEFDQDLIFDGENDVTITCAGGNASLWADVVIK